MESTDSVSIAVFDTNCWESSELTQRSAVRKIMQAFSVALSKQKNLTIVIVSPFFLSVDDCETLKLSIVDTAQCEIVCNMQDLIVVKTPHDNVITIRLIAGSDKFREVDLSQVVASDDEDDDNNKEEASSLSNS